MNSGCGKLNFQFSIDFQLNHKFSLTKPIEAQILTFLAPLVDLETRDYFVFEEEEKIRRR